MMYQYTGSQPYNADWNVKKDGKIQQLNVRLSQGDHADLPEDHDAVKSLVTAGHLKEISNPEPTNQKRKKN